MKVLVTSVFAARGMDIKGVRWAYQTRTRGADRAAFNPQGDLRARPAVFRALAAAAKRAFGRRGATPPTTGSVITAATRATGLHKACIGEYLRQLVCEGKYIYDCAAEDADSAGTGGSGAGGGRRRQRERQRGGLVLWHRQAVAACSR